VTQVPSRNLSSFTVGCGSNSCVNITLSLTQETAATVRKRRCNFGQNGKRDFFGRFAANIESGRREQVSNARVEIARSVFAEPRLLFGVAFSWPKQPNISELKRQETIEREKIATEIVIHDQRGGLPVWTKIFVELRRMTETLDNPPEISSELSNRFDLRPGSKE
jgi:hypothetical protein